jgi:hypothetical protein
MPPYGIAQFYDQVYGDPFNINRRDSEIIIGSDGKAKTVPIIPMTSDEIMAGSIVPNDFDAQRFQSIFPTNNEKGIVSQMEFVEDDDLESSAIPRFGEDQLKQSGGIGDLFRNVMNFTPTGILINLFRGGVDGLRNLSNRIQQSDFGRSKNLMDFIDMKKYGGFDAREDARAATMTQARGIQKKIEAGDYGTASNQDRGRGDRPGGATYSAPSKSSSKASSYRDSKDFGSRFHG